MADNTGTRASGLLDSVPTQRQTMRRPLDHETLRSQTAHRRDLGVASILRTGVQIDFCPDLSAVVQDDEGGRDYRTEPGVLTPGTDKKGTRPEGGGREAFSALDAERDPQRISAAPSGRGPIVNVSWG